MEENRSDPSDMRCPSLTSLGIFEQSLLGLRKEDCITTSRYETQEVRIVCEETSKNFKGDFTTKTNNVPRSRGPGHNVGQE